MADTRDLLLEIGVEELPARFCQPALDQLRQKATAALDEARLAHGPVDTFGTPRRLVLLVRDLALRQEDRELVARGPAAKAAFDAEGNPTRAAEGFARSQGVAVADLEIRAAEAGGEYVYARRMEEGQSVTAVLPPLLAKLVLSLEFPKSMRWSDKSIRFARPIRWICCLLGAARVPFSVDGLETTRTTWGHRALAPTESPPLETPQDYFSKAGHMYVMVDQVQRREIIWQKVQEVASALGGYVPRDEDLLDEVTWLVEQPFAFHGSFDPAYLEVPAEVLVTSMRSHQRYFPVYERAGGRLLPYFIAVRNGLDEALENVRAGNQKVLRARLADARFFFDEDRKVTLEQRREKLRHIVFQERLGSLLEKSQRLEWLAGQTALRLGMDQDDAARSVQAARLAKADLATHMVYEFPELQGVMGREYARLEGLENGVARAIYEHYLPRFAGDELPATPAGTITALVDKLDTLAGFFSVGLIPTGSQDPYALRRAAQGAMLVILESELRVSLSLLIGDALAGYRIMDGDQRERTARELAGFLRARLDGILRERGYRYDVVEAVLAAGYDDPVDAVLRAGALSRLLEDAQFQDVFLAFKRVANLAVKAADYGAAGAVVNPALLQEGPERELWQAFAAAREGLEAALDSRDYAGFYHRVVRLKPHVDLFLDKVLVMADDPAVRQNRLAMLDTIARLLGSPADLGRLSVG